jgi:hypothetical protein
MSCVPKYSGAMAANDRAKVSLPPPAPHGTMSVIGFTGYFSDWAKLVTSDNNRVVNAIVSNKNIQIPFLSLLFILTLLSF